ncbi:MAG: hypothetical protein ABIV94_06745, partial [Acidimicrobiales bacterium]
MPEHQNIVEELAVTLSDSTSTAAARAAASPAAQPPATVGVSVVVVTYRSARTIEACLDPLVG